MRGPTVRSIDPSSSPDSTAGPSTIRGGAPSSSRLGVAYFEGQGVEKNETEAARWFTQAAELGNVESAFNLAVLYETGVGVNKSIADAYKWYTLGAHAGDKASAARAEVLAKQLPQASLRRP